MPKREKEVSYDMGGNVNVVPDWEGAFYTMLQSGRVVSMMSLWICTLELARVMGVGKEAALRPDFYISVPAAAIVGLAAARIAQWAEGKDAQMWQQRRNKE